MERWFVARSLSDVQPDHWDDAFWSAAVGRILCDTPDVLVLQYSDEALTDVRLFIVARRTRQAKLTVSPALDPSATYAVGTTTRTAASLAVDGLVLTMPANGMPVDVYLRQCR